MTEPEDIDLLAAEYVLGTADAAERARVAARLLAGDPALARAVAAWEERLAPLAEAAPGAAPPGDGFARIAARLFGPTPAPAGAADPVPAGAADPRLVAGLRAEIRRWRAAAAGLALLAAALALVAVLPRGTPPPGGAFVAVLRRDAGAPAVLVEVDLARRRLLARPLDAAAPAGRSYELWIIDPALGAPRSLGVLPARAGVDASLGAFDPGVIAGATYAVTLEPAGGSPSGAPTSAPVLTGRLVGPST